MKTKAIHKVTKYASIAEIAEACGVTRQAVERWLKNGYLPRTDWTGETSHASNIERLTGGKVTEKQLLKRRKAVA